MHGAIAEKVGEARLMWAADDGTARPLPAWASWLLLLGRWAGCINEPGNTFWIIVSVPDRRYASSLLAHGAVTARVGSRELPPVAARFGHAVPNDGLTWIDSNGHSRFGRFRGLEKDRIVYEPRVHGGWGVRTEKLLTHAQTFWPAGELEAFVGARPVSENPEFAGAATGVPGSSFLAASRIEVTIAGLRTEIDRDLTEQRLLASEAWGTLRDTVRPRHLCQAGEHWRSLVVPSSADPASLDAHEADVPTVFDGPQAYLRLRDQLIGSVNIVVIDRWHPRSGDAASAARIERAETWVEHHSLDFADPPPGVEVFAWAADR
jgi:hypothetical protein